jgi:LacI family transcriptional regulator
MACDDARARHIVLACGRAGLAVPEDVAVIGVNNDEIMCDMVEPPLTSVQQGTERIACEATALLEQMSRSRRKLSSFLSVAPVGIVTRRSTDSLWVGDHAVA